MDNNIKLHEIQKQILKKFSRTNSIRFNDLLVEGLESEHMNYHLKKLLEYGLVAKNSQYSLTDKGKDFVNLLDDNVNLIERQPKTSVLIHAIRQNKNNRIEHLLYRRLKQPYLNYVGKLGGKVRYGETIYDAAKRELLEETGLTSNNLVLEEIYHKMRYREPGNYVQDVIFYIFHTLNPQGTLIERTLDQENFWATKEDVFTPGKYQLFDGLVLDENLSPQPLKFVESIEQVVDGY